MMTNKEVFEIAKKQSALDYSFNRELIDKEGYTIVPSIKPPAEARNYLSEALSFNFLYYGTGLVCVADEKFESFAKGFIEKNKESLFRVFDAPQISEVAKKLHQEGYVIAHIADFYLPDVNFKAKINEDIRIEILFGDEILPLYDIKGLDMALSYSRTDNRRDEIAVVGYIDDQLAGVAACSNDSETMWQIGIDVIPEFRFRGVASTLTYLLSKEILSLGKVPFYGTAYSNIASKNTARKAGFRSAWVELTAKKEEEAFIY